MEKTCPQCKYKIPAEANICNLCGYNFNQEKNQHQENSLKSEIQNSVTRVIKSTIKSMLISFILIGLLLFGVLYFVFAKLVPAIESGDTETVFTNMNMIFAALPFIIPIIILIIAIITIKQIISNFSNQNYSFSKGINILKDLTQSRNFQLTCKDCGHTIDLDLNHHQTITKCPSCQGSNFKINAKN